MSESAPPEVPAYSFTDPPPDPLPPTLIESEISCRHCGYILRGLTDTGNCPECGTPVALSTVSDQLRFASPAWLRLMHIAVRLIFWTILISLGAFILTVLVIAVWPFNGSRVLALLIGLAGQAVGLVGTWLLTVPNPADLKPALPTTRALARISTTVYFVLSLFNLVIVDFWTLGIPWAVVFTMSILGGAARVTTIVTQLLVISSLAYRIPDAAMGKRAILLARGLGICYGLILASSAVASLGGASRSAAIMVLGCITATCAIPALIFIVMNFTLILRLGRVLKNQRVLAAQALQPVEDPWKDISPPA